MPNSIVRITLKLLFDSLLSTLLPWRWLICFLLSLSQSWWVWDFLPFSCSCSWIPLCLWVCRSHQIPIANRRFAVMSPMLGRYLSGSSLDGFAHSQVEVCGLEILGREKQRQGQRHRIEGEGDPVMLTLPAVIFRNLYIPQSKRGGVREKTSLPLYKEQSDFLFNTGNIQ